MPISIIVVYHSGFGHTKKVAEAVGQGAAGIAGTSVQVLSVDTFTEQNWTSLDEADAIIFGAPTYMGGVSAQFKTFVDAASARWMKQSWKNKIAAGFTNSGNLAGDNLSTLTQLVLNAMQHSMIWVGTGVMPPSGKGLQGAGPEDLNRVGSFLGVATQSANDSPSVTPPAGDLETARLLGARVANITAQFARGAR